MIEKIKHYFLETLWNFSIYEKTGKKQFFYKWTRILFLSVRGFVEDQCSLRASSLTYYTIMSMVPVMALAFAVAKGFGLYQHFRVQILQQFPEHEVIFTELFKYADILLDQTRGSFIAGFGVILLIITAILMLSSLEGILNHIWGVNNLRTWWRIFTDYLAIMIFAPIFFIIANTMAVIVEERLSQIIHSFPISQTAISWLLFLVHLLPYCLFWILFTFIYFFIPNIKVHFRSAFLAGVIGGTAYLILQWGYIYFQVGVSRYGAIYGSMAAVPLFLVWLQLSWALLLFGVEISYAHQMAEEYEYERPIGRMSARMKKIISLWIAYLAVQEGFLSIEALAKHHKIPKGLSKQILQELADAKILAKGKNGYIPTERLFEMRLSDCLEALEMQGEDRFPFIKPDAFFQKALVEFQKTIQTHPQNVRLKDVPHPF
ncbi:MAG: YihY family inner membrane protein [Parachlamydiales bacterium]|nr:YihY family inner membrane protein [Parachlamydiales bacterium]